MSILNKHLITGMTEYHCSECYMNMTFDSDRFCLCCENCQNTHVLLTPQCKIVKIGIELEGAWSEMPDNEGNQDDWLYHSYMWHDDSSVEGLEYGGEECGDCDYCCNDEGDHCYHRENGSSGEIISYPMPINGTWRNWVNKYYPEDLNSSCGGHFHVSFDNVQAFELLCTQEFFNHFIQELTRWGKRAHIRNQNFWDRLANENTMCNIDYRGEQQLYIRHDNYPNCRYSALNYQYHKHGTLEIRVLPMFQDWKIYCKAVEVSMGIIQKYLDRMANKPIPIDNQTVEPETDFNGRISNTMVMEYMNEEIEVDLSGEITMTNDYVTVNGYELTPEELLQS